MPGSDLAFRITDVFRARLASIRATAEAQTVALFRQVDVRDLDGTFPLDALDSAITTQQAEAIRTADVYFAAFMSAETGAVQGPVGVDPLLRAGSTRDGRPIATVLALSVMSMKLATVQGSSAAQVRLSGLARAVRVARTESVDAGRQTVQDLMDQDDRVSGYQRVTAGEPCGACLALAGNTIPTAEAFPLHGACQCVGEPVVSGVRQTVLRPTGRDLLESMGPDRAAELYGDKVAGDLSSLATITDAEEWGPVLFETPAATLSG